MIGKLNMFVLTAALLSVLGAVAGRADAASVRFGKSRTYIMNYEVQGNFAVPVMGVITDDIGMGVRDTGPYRYTGYAYSGYGNSGYDLGLVRPPLRAPNRLLPQDADALRRFLADTLPRPRPPLQ